MRDHPRVGGEKRRLSECAQWAEGSPPRGRGKGGLALCWPPPPRITPAWAGKSTAVDVLTTAIKDHPRAGGEKHWMMMLVLEPVGSPPRGRGKAGRRRIGGQAVWITPAWAGKRNGLYIITDKQKDHPRVGGEKG